MNEAHADLLKKRKAPNTEKTLHFFSVPDFATKAALCCLAGRAKIN